MRLKPSRLGTEDPLDTPEITLYHHESKDAGSGSAGDPEKRARSAAGEAVLETRWGTLLEADPSLNPLWHTATHCRSALCPAPFANLGSLGLMSSDAPRLTRGCRKRTVVGTIGTLVPVLADNRGQEAARRVSANARPRRWVLSFSWMPGVNGVCYFTGCVGTQGGYAGCRNR